MIPRRWCCTFENGVGESRTIAIGLDKVEWEAARHAADPEVTARAIALRHAYKKVPRNFRHSGAPVPAWEC
jgi:hypothetical protein